MIVLNAGSVSALPVHQPVCGAEFVGGVATSSTRQEAEERLLARWETASAMGTGGNGVERDLDS